MDPPHERLAVFKSDSGVTLSLGDKSYFIDAKDPFHNISLRALEQGDYIPFYVEIAKREGLGPKFRDTLIKKINELEEHD